MTMSRNLQVQKIQMIRIMYHSVLKINSFVQVHYLFYFIFPKTFFFFFFFFFLSILFYFDKTGEKVFYFDKTGEKVKAVYNPATKRVEIRKGNYYFKK